MKERERTCNFERENKDIGRSWYTSPGPIGRPLTLLKTSSWFMGSTVGRMGVFVSVISWVSTEVSMYFLVCLSFLVGLLGSDLTTGVGLNDWGLFT